LFVVCFSIRECSLYAAIDVSITVHRDGGSSWRMSNATADSDADPSAFNSDDQRSASDDIDDSLTKYPKRLFFFFCFVLFCCDADDFVHVAPAPTPQQGSPCFEFTLCEQCTNRALTVTACRWCSRAVGDGVCSGDNSTRVLSLHLNDFNNDSIGPCPAAFGLSVNSPAFCPVESSFSVRLSKKTFQICSADRFLRATRRRRRRRWRRLRRRRCRSTARRSFVVRVSPSRNALGKCVSLFSNPFRSLVVCEPFSRQGACRAPSVRMCATTARARRVAIRRHRSRRRRAMSMPVTRVTIRRRGRTMAHDRARARLAVSIGGSFSSLRSALVFARFDFNKVQSTSVSCSHCCRCHCCRRSATRSQRQ
jgi:hypothetical protein